MEQLSVTAGEDGGTYEVELRIHYGNDDLFWVETTTTLASGESVLVDATVPAEAFMVADQARWLSDLVVTVRRFADGQVTGVFSPALMRVAWDSAGEAPYVFDPELALQLAPGDAWDLTAPGVAGTVEAYDDLNPPTSFELPVETDPDPAEVL